MDEYIEKRAALDEAKKHLIEQECDCEVMIAIFEELQGLPTADVAPVVHGRWLFVASVFGRDFWVCSECGRSIKTNEDNPVNKFPYCHCGARMEKEE